MLKKKAVSRSPKGDIKSKGSAPPKRAKAKGSSLRAMSGRSAKTVGKTNAHKLKAASTTKPKAVQPPAVRNHRRPAMRTQEATPYSRQFRPSNMIDSRIY